MNRETPDRLRALRPPATRDCRLLSSVLGGAVADRFSARLDVEGASF